VSDHHKVFNTQRTCGALGASLAAIAVVLGALGAHGEHFFMNVHSSADPKSVAGMELPAAYKYMQDFRTAAWYHLIHAIAIIAVGLLGRGGQAWKFAVSAAVCFVGGILLFSGSIYVLALSELTWLGRVAPIGGLLFIAGWILFAIAAVLPRSRPRAED
jgi:uncharacterized membrane protein YgdD (TMEM256/DUF423 family)